MKFVSFTPVRSLRAPPLGLAFAMATTAVLSFTAIGAKSFWLDEAFSVAVASLDLPGLWHIVAHDQANMAL